MCAPRDSLSEDYAPALAGMCAQPIKGFGLRLRDVQIAYERILDDAEGPRCIERRHTAW